MTAEDWVRKNKNVLARQFINRSIYQSSDHPAGIFTAGLPGAGKTEFTVQLIESLSDKPIRLDMDEIACQIEGYNPRKADLFRGSASILLAKIFDIVLRERIDFVYDGTLAHSNAINNVQRAIDKGYGVKIYYIHQDPIRAWTFTQLREIVEHRAITREGFMKAYKNIQVNMRVLSNIGKGVTISVILQDDENKVGQRYEDVSNIFEVVPKFLTEDQLRAAIL